MFSYKANAICMAGMTMPTGAGVAASHCWNRVRKPGQLINYVRFWPHRWTVAKNRTAHAQTEKVHSGNGAVSLVVSPIKYTGKTSCKLLINDGVSSSLSIYNSCPNFGLLQPPQTVDLFYHNLSNFVWFMMWATGHFLGEVQPTGNKAPSSRKQHTGPSRVRTHNLLIVKSSRTARLLSVLPISVTDSLFSILNVNVIKVCHLRSSHLLPVYPLQHSMTFTLFLTLLE